MAESGSGSGSGSGSAAHRRYQEYLNKRREEERCTVFATAFGDGAAGAGAAERGLWMVSASSTGRVSMWLLPRLLDASAWYESTEPNLRPYASFVAHEDGPIYCVSFSLDGRFLITGGLEEIRVWDWARILDEIRASEAARDDTTSSSGTATTIEIQATCAHRLRADQRHGLRGSVAMRPETNSLAIDELSGHLMSAGGDGVARTWDLTTGQCVNSFQATAASDDYLHCIVARPKQRQFLAGSDHGMLSLWDVRSGSATNVLDLQSGTARAAVVTSAKRQPHVSCMAIDASNDWLVAGSGAGYLTLWYLPSLLATAVMPTAGTPHSVLFDDDVIVSGGNDTALSQWSISGKLMQRVPTTTKSTYSIAINHHNPKYKIMVSSGASAAIDCYATRHQRSFSVTSIPL